jgi:hypothetical protein
MDETDTSQVTGPEAMSAEAARQWAEQQRAQARAQFDTPSWLGPTRSDAPAVIPEQAEPEHDDLEIVVPKPVGAPIPEAAHWAEKARPRLFAGTVLGLSLVGVLTFLVLTIVNQSAGAIAGLAACAFVDPVHLVQLIGTPDQPTWRLRLEAVDGRVVEVGPQHVDAPELHRIVEYYRAIAERDKRDRERRFNR